jgi:RNA polymerase sigma factor (sigma-70 family)
VTAQTSSSVEHLLRELAPQVLSSLVRRYHNFTDVEDAVQEALIAAAQHWASELPTDPRAWLRRVASRRLVDQVRADAARRHREEFVVSLIPADEQFDLIADAEAGRDDSLQLLFMCCHPALTPASAIALTLRAVGGLTTKEIAHAYLVPEATMAQRIARAKDMVRETGDAFEALTEAECARRLDAVLHTLYLMFNEGYSASSGGDVTRTELSGEALRLTRLLQRLVPEQPEVTGLLALMLLTDARRLARTGDAGELIPLDQQDRTLWDQHAIEEGISLLTGVLRKGAPGPYQLQAAVAALHDEAETAAETDWLQIRELYLVLDGLAENPMVKLNLAVAHAMVEGPKEGLRMLEVLEQDVRLVSTHRLEAVRAHLLERAGDVAAAVQAFRSAAQKTSSTAERSYLLLRAANLLSPNSQTPSP